MKRWLQAFLMLQESLFSKGPRTVQGPTHLPKKLVSGTLFQGVKQPERETHLHLEFRLRMSRNIKQPFQYSFLCHRGIKSALLWDVVTRNGFKQLHLEAPLSY